MFRPLNSGVEYLNLADASEAERDILRNMLFTPSGQGTTANVLFEFLKPNPAMLNQVENVSEASRGNEIPPASVEPSHQNMPTMNESPPEMLNEPLIQVPMQNLHIMEPVVTDIQNGEQIPNTIISQVHPPTTVRGYFAPPIPHMQGGGMPPHSMGHPGAVPLTIYQSPIPHTQVLQTAGGPYFGQGMSQYQVYPYNYQSQYFTDGVEHPHNPNLHHTQNHHDSHAPNSMKYRNNNPRSKRGRNEDISHAPYGAPPPYYQQNVGFGVYNMYNPGMAQTVSSMTGHPIIMNQPPQGSPYSPHSTQGHVYTTGADMSHAHPIPMSVVPVEMQEVQTILSPHPIINHVENRDPIVNSKNAAKTTDVYNTQNILKTSQKIPLTPTNADLPGNENDKDVKNKEDLASLLPNPEKKAVEDNVVAPNANDVVVRKANHTTDNSKEYAATVEQIPPTPQVEARKPSPEVPEGFSNNNTASTKSTNGPVTSTWAPIAPQAKTKYSDAPDFPELGGAVGPTIPKVAGPVKERSWASIASSKTSNGPSNGIISVNVNQMDSVNASNANVGQQNLNNVVVGDESNSDGYHPNTNANVYMQKSPRVPVPSVKNEVIENSDKSILADDKDPVALQLGEFLSNYTLDHHSLSLTPRGLSNQSNFCYINATLQSLIACPPFVNLFRALRDIIGRRPCKATPIIQSMFHFVMEFDPITRVNQGRGHKRPSETFYVGSNFEAAGIRKVLGLFDGATFKVEGRQEDAEEFLSHLLNGLHDEMIKVIKWFENRNSPSTSHNSNDHPNLPVTNGESPEVRGDEDDADWQVMGPKNKGCMTRKTSLSKSPISEMFVGTMLSALNRTIGVKSTTSQPFFTLQLDIQEENVHSVRDALEGLSIREEVTGFTSVSGQETEAWRQLSLETLPIILILHMKRFVYDKNKIHKLDKKVDFPVDLEIGRELLTISSKGKYTPKQRQYKLFAAVYHDGEEAHKGHYIADCFHPSGGSLWGQFGWIRYDDTAVKGIPEGQILNPQPPRVPYLLYYRRVDTLSPAKKERL